MVNKLRAQRIAERIREELSVILVMESVDPRLGGVTVTDVEIDRELEYATIYVSALEGSERSKEILEGLAHAQGYLRTELAHRVELRTVPKLRFRWDATAERAEAMERLFAQMEEEERSKREGEIPASPDEKSNSSEADMNQQKGGNESDE